MVGDSSAQNGLSAAAEPLEITGDASPFGNAAAAASPFAFSRDGMTPSPVSPVLYGDTPTLLPPSAKRRRLSERDSLSSPGKSANSCETRAVDARVLVAGFGVSSDAQLFGPPTIVPYAHAMEELAKASKGGASAAPLELVPLYSEGTAWRAQAPATAGLRRSPE